ncbi:hypothetical protein CFB3_28750 [Clostridium folliculivorans]|uniref:Uncharacterized protein n=2 Tax=Clostridium folliculivorans TaxID=2886038 RepID=A0A9W5Y135_9CLOT|nr:hypothetical protein [Clostridium folliculivorans]GKU24670.1 hypothetical protein CFOLD11_14960 [Clostridium folliculivorans]GKU30768.1 hypothetical protein CFB3_28750 [Clostridium folliculivorans]
MSTNSLEQVIIICGSWFLFSALYKKYDLLSFLKKKIKLKTNTAWIAFICVSYVILEAIIGELMYKLNVQYSYIVIFFNIFMGFFLSLLAAATFKKKTKK